MRIEWEYVPPGKVSVGKLKGYRSRAYMWGESFHVEAGKRHRHWLYLGAVVHSKEDDLLLEIIQRGQDGTIWHPSNGDVISTYFTELNVPMRSHFQEVAEKTKANLVKDGQTGRTFIRVDCKKPLYSTGFNLGRSDKTIKKDNIQHSILGDMIQDYGNWLVIMLVFPKTIKHTCDAKDVLQAMLNIRHSGPAIWSNYFENEKERLRNKLVDLRANLEDNEKGFVRICESAATALDELSGRFGIEIDMSMDDAKSEVV